MAFAQPADKAASPASRAPAKPTVAVDRIAAVVNGDIITLQELNERKRMVLRQLEKQGTPLPPDDVLSRQVLERMIANLVQTQLAKENGIKVDDAQLDRTLQRIAQENKMTLSEFRAAIEKDGMNY
ncbi:MAG: SurA N-terminal domain-containing protein, partial [Burkholderiales bacterium]|nr:SurA N-terminal domain-containing protein [Burkholderiales bacterium]